jgi:sulfoquinovosidase
MIYPLAVFIIVIFIQVALIYWNSFSPFERESNWRSVMGGARPGLRFWAVALVDVCAGLLLVLLAIGVWPHSSERWDELVFIKSFPGWVFVGGAYAMLHHFVNDAIVHVPRIGLIARRLGIAFIFGILVSLGMTFLATFSALDGDFSQALAQTWPVLQTVGIPIFLLGLLIYLASPITFFLRILPLGIWLQPLASTGLLVWYFSAAGQLVGNRLGIGLHQGLAGVDGLTDLIMVAAWLALAAAWRLPGAVKHSDGSQPPPILIASPEEIEVRKFQSREAVALESDELIVRAQLSPFSLTVHNCQGVNLLRLDEHSLWSDSLVYNMLAIPILYTGNTLKFKWRIASRPAGKATGVQIDGSTITVKFARATLRITLFNLHTLRLEFQPQKSVLHNATSLTFPIPADAHFLGFGQRFNRVDQRGRELDFLVEEGGVGYAGLAPVLSRIWGPRGTFPNGESCTSFPVPFGLIGRENGTAWGLFWNTYKPSWFKSDSVQAHNSSARLTVLEPSLDLFICAGPTPLEAIQQYSGLTGLPEIAPPWVLLPWKTRTGPVTEEDVLEDIRRYRQLNIPVGQVGVENWQAVRGSYEFNPKTFPHIDQVISEARAQGQQVQIWHFPYMNRGSALYREGIRKGYFLQNQVGLPYLQRIFHGVAAVIDYSNQSAAVWHEAILKRAIYERGFAGTMSDYAESIPPDCVFYNGQSGLALRNAYPVMYCQSMQRAAQEARGEDYLLYPRAGYAASQRFINAQFPGDQDTDWDDGDGLPAAVRAMLNISMAGFPLHGSDIGGWFDALTPITSKELFIRWAEVGTYSPLMRAHGGPFGRNREPWKFDPETIDIYAQLSRERVKLFPYLYSLLVEAAHTGRPLVIHPALLWPERSDLYSIEDAWMLGEALYVAPVIRQGQTQRDVILPPGKWWNLAADRAVEGPARIQVEAPLDRIPLFLRQGFILPRFVKPFDTFESGVKGRVGSLADDLEIWLYPGSQPTDFKLFDGNILRSDQQSSLSGTRRINWKIFQ